MSKSSCPLDLMVRVETTADEDVLGWVRCTCDGYLTLDLVGDDKDGWRVAVPWEAVTSVVDVTEFMTVGPAWARAGAV